MTSFNDVRVSEARVFVAPTTLTNHVVATTKTVALLALLASFDDILGDEAIATDGKRLWVADVFIRNGSAGDD
jgi:hypothetical protein